MSKKKFNSRNTENPYELISGVELISKDNKNIKVGISAIKFSYVSNVKGKKDLVMLNFDTYSKYEPKHKHDCMIISKFKCLEKFAALRHSNPMEAITAFVDCYKQNRNIINIKFIPCPAYTDALDSKFIYESLINN